MKTLRRIGVITMMSAAFAMALAAARPAHAESAAAAAAAANAAAQSREVRDATLNYYVALNSVLKGDVDPMTKVWSHASDVLDMPSSGGRESGWNAILDAYRGLTHQGITGSIVPAQVAVTVEGNLAFSTCVETGETRAPGGYPVKHRERATNIFRLENGHWKVICHHADAVAEQDATSH
jgi:ketosteroid isomerase-like protein